jgi:hypothetical protein
MDATAAQALWAWYRKGGFESISAWLHARDVTKFNPAAAPAMTEFKANLVEHGMSMAESFLVEMLRARKGEFARGVIGSPMHALCDRLTGLAPSNVKVPQAALLHALKEAGWVDCGRLASADFKSKKHIYAAPEVAQALSKSELRRAVEDAPTPQSVNIK